MTFEEKEDLKKEIQAQIDIVKKDLMDAQGRVKPFVSERSHGRMGRIDAIQQRSMRERGIRSLESKLLELEGSLVRIDSPEFGVCECCKEPIGDERRRALPEAKKCIKCAEKYP